MRAGSTCVTAARAISLKPVLVDPRQTAEHLVVGTSYVALNPVRAGVCAHPAEWRWTTHRELAGLEPPRLVKADGLLRMLGNDDIARGREAYVRMIDDDLERLRATPASASGIGLSG